MYPTKKEVWPYITSRILLGVAAPLILALSLIPLATILRFITNGKVELNQFLPVLSEGTIQYKTHKDIAYWVVQDLFYFPIGIPAKQINSWKSALKQGKNLTLDDITIQNVKAISPSNPQWWTHWYHAFDWSPATWLLYMTQCLILVIVLTYVVNNSFITQNTYKSCRELTTFELYNYNCFKSLENNYVDCTNANTTSTDDVIACYYFHRLRNSKLPLQPFIEALLFHFMVGKVIQVMYRIVKLLQHFYKSKIWSVLIAILGIVAVLVSTAVTLAGIFIDEYLNILKLVQPLIVCTIVIAAGLLLCKAHLFQIKKLEYK